RPLPGQAVEKAVVDGSCVRLQPATHRRRIRRFAGSCQRFDPRPDVAMDAVREEARVVARLEVAWRAIGEEQDVGDHDALFGVVTQTLEVGAHYAKRRSDVGATSTGVAEASRYSSIHCDLKRSDRPWPIRAARSRPALTASYRVRTATRAYCAAS